MHVQMVLETPHHQQLFPKASKCQFIRSSPASDFLGQWHVISERGVAVDPRKITVVAEWATQTPCTDASRGKYVQTSMGWFALVRMGQMCHGQTNRKPNWVLSGGTSSTPIIDLSKSIIALSKPIMNHCSIQTNHCNIQTHSLVCNSAAVPTHCRAKQML
jgi:hypothetical protein